MGGILKCDKKQKWWFLINMIWNNQNLVSFTPKTPKLLVIMNVHQKMWTWFFLALYSHTHFWTLQGWWTEGRRSQRTAKETESQARGWNHQVKQHLVQQQGLPLQKELDPIKRGDHWRHPPVAKEPKEIQVLGRDRMRQNDRYRLPGRRRPHKHGGRGGWT